METTTETKRYCLSNKNYATWATMMKAELYGLGLMEFVKKEEVSGTSRTGANNTDLETNKLKFKIKKSNNVAMTVSQTNKRIMKCYNCGTDGHSAKQCPKEWKNYKFAPPKANLGEAGNNQITVAFFSTVYHQAENIEYEFYEPEEEEQDLSNCIVGRGCTK
ncbi:hypothetical protein BY996DRAFT_6412807 [Phakopsora pachyrhizi]|nr:hypothetical protein BY996DRAFT_6412807 [Phakopsora pachyrhizi]